MDGCKEPLVNFKNGRFCEAHLEIFGGLCGIIPCGRPVSHRGSVTCDDPAHVAWYNGWASRFGRLKYANVRRVIRQQRQAADVLGGPHFPDANAVEDGRPHLRVRLPNLGDVSGDQVVHLFRARTVYCLETVQWSCGMPIGWGKCYTSESSPQVLGIINHLWHGYDHLRPSFITYDDACDLLRHIATQNPDDSWLKTTKFIVDAWHYIGHRSIDALCRLWCNPAPTNGSQPDLIVVQQDGQGNKHQTRAFNTETAEQLNAWLNNYEASLRQMTDVNFDIFVHALFLIFTEDVEARIQKRDRTLPEDFWNAN